MAPWTGQLGGNEVGCGMEWELCTGRGGGSRGGKAGRLAL